MKPREWKQRFETEIVQLEINWRKLRSKGERDSLQGEVGRLVDAEWEDMHVVGRVAVVGKQSSCAQV